MLTPTDHADKLENSLKRIHQALRGWNTPQADGTLDDLLLAHSIKSQRTGLSPRLITNQILLNGLDRLKQTDEAAANLLQWRFLDQETALALAYRLNVSEDIVFQRQRTAISQLSEIIWAEEQNLRQEQRQRVESRLEPPMYSRLFGATVQLAELRTRLETNGEPWLISLEGLGGIGKTSLADALVRELAGGTYFREIAWVSARRRLFRLSGEIEMLVDRPDLTLAELIDGCIDQFGLTELKRRSDSEKLAGLKEFCRGQPCLVVVDNLETIAEAYYSLVSQLATLVNPGKVLFTTRYSLRDMSGVLVVPLRQLAVEDACALIRHEAETRGLPELANASDEALYSIHEVTGGNPLATKLLVGQIHSLSLPDALAQFNGAKGKPVEELLTYLYDAAWQALNAQERLVMQALLLVIDEGGRIAQLAAATDLDLYQVAACLHRLATLSLVNVRGDLRDRRYGLHHLTQLFVARHSMPKVD